MVILEDPAYPALPWLMKPYQETVHTTAGQKTFNYRQSRARMVVENAFGRLKGRWRCLLKRLDFQLENVPHVVSSCVVLHNICETFGDCCLDEWTDSTSPHPLTTCASSSGGSDTASAHIRNAIMQHLIHYSVFSFPHFFKVWL